MRQKSGRDGFMVYQRWTALEKQKAEMETEVHRRGAEAQRRRGAERKAVRSLDLVTDDPYVLIMANSKRKKTKPKALLLGVGLDSDGHKRVTTGPNFALVGGSEETHEVMTEKVIKINEKLAAKGKQLEQVSREEFDDIALSVGLTRPKSNESNS